MRANRRRLFVAVAAALAIVPVLGPAATMEQAAQTTKPLALQDIINWKNIGTTIVSNDGQWFAYRIAPGEGDAQVVVTRTQGASDAKPMTFEVGEVPAAGAAGPGRGGDAGGAAASVD